MTDRALSEREELANVLSHGFGFVLFAVIGLPVLVLSGLRNHSYWPVTGGVIFGLSLLLVYGSSTVYHLLPRGRLKARFRLLDHAAIFVLIAGTYTPFALGPLRGPWGWSIFIVAWTLAAGGVALKVWLGFRYESFCTLIYLLMGWMVLLVVQPLVANIGGVGFGWIVAGGVSYSLGVVFFLWRRLHYSHLYWHALVLLGSICHFVAVARYA